MIFNKKPERKVLRITTELKQNNQFAFNLLDSCGYSRAILLIENERDQNNILITLKDEEVAKLALSKLISKAEEKVVSIYLNLRILKLI